MRGSLIVTPISLQTAGIIPAHAGLTYQYKEAARNGRDHPRACGAHSNLYLIQSTVKGSSPRMRGSQLINMQFGQLKGIIPAHAGLTSPPHTKAREARDHPRACGAHTEVSDMKKQYEGSSPRMRGSHIFSIDNVTRVGIIPAHAGLTAIAAS